MTLLPPPPPLSRPVPLQTPQLQPRHLLLALRAVAKGGARRAACLARALLRPPLLAPWAVAGRPANTRQAPLLLSGWPPGAYAWDPGAHRSVHVPLMLPNLAHRIVAEGGMTPTTTI